MTQQIQEQKSYIKVSRNTKGFTYEYKIISSEGIDILEQVDYIKEQMEDRIKDWNSELNFKDIKTK